MSARIHVSAGERGRVWVFAVDLDPDEIAAFSRRNGDWPLRGALGADALDPEHVDVFDVSDLRGLGLAAYLEEGHGVAPEQLAPLRARLDAQEGAVLVLTSRAVAARDQVLIPHEPLRLLASLAEERPPVAFAPLPSEAATGTLSPAGGGTGGGPLAGGVWVWIWLGALALILVVAAIIAVSRIVS